MSEATSTSTSTPELVLYTSTSPNGSKVSIALEELGLPYEVFAVDMVKGQQKEAWFKEINPNACIPALTDKSFPGGPLHIFESGAILQYLADHYDPEHRISYPRGSREFWQSQAWLHFEMGGIGPMEMQAFHFLRYAIEKHRYAITRYQDETSRLYSVLNTQLIKNNTGFLVGDHVSIADIASFGWVRVAAWIGIEIAGKFPELEKWVMMLHRRPAFKKGFDVPTDRMMQLLYMKSEEEIEKAIQDARRMRGLQPVESAEEEEDNKGE